MKIKVYDRFGKVIDTKTTGKERKNRKGYYTLECSEKNAKLQYVPTEESNKKS